MTAEEKRLKDTASMRDVLSKIISQYGLGRKRSEDELQDTWEELVGKALADYSRVAGVKRGALEILVSDAIFMQELMFRKDELLKGLKERFPQAKWSDLKFRIGK